MVFPIPNLNGTALILHCTASRTPSLSRMVPVIAGVFLLVACSTRAGGTPSVQGAGQQLDDSIVAALTHPDATECRTARCSYPNSRQPHEDAFFHISEMKAESTDTARAVTSASDIATWYIDRIQTLTGEAPVADEPTALIEAEAALESAFFINTVIAGAAVGVSIASTAGSPISITLRIGASGDWVASDCT
jgi:hypothetical protein